MQNVNNQLFTPPHNESSTALNGHFTAVKDKTIHRQEWIDCLRGITMLLVIFGHIEIYSAAPISEMSKIIYTFHMPLFFFISGFLSYSPNYNLRTVIPSLTKRFLNIFVPTLIIASLFLIINASIAGLTLKDMMYDVYKGGYWFTLVMMEIFILYIPINLIISRKQTKKWLVNSALILLMLVSAIISNFIKAKYNNSDFVNLFSIIFIFQYCPYFLLGTMIRYNIDKVLYTFNRSYVILILVGIYCIGLHFTPLLRFGKDDFRFTFCIAALLVALFMLFSKISSVKSNIITKRLAHIGRKTLPIYLFHYFIIILLSTELCQSFCDWSHLNTNHLIPITLALALLIAYLCILIDYMLAYFHIRRFIFPK